MREQEHCTHSGATNMEHAGENQQSYKFIASDLPRGRGQNERQVEQGVTVEHNHERNGYPDSPERQ